MGGKQKKKKNSMDQSVGSHLRKDPLSYSREVEDEVELDRSLLSTNTTMCKQKSLRSKP